VAADDGVLDHLGAEKLIVDVTLPAHGQLLLSTVGSRINKIEKVIRWRRVGRRDLS
jgi:hypothetical protein